MFVFCRLLITPSSPLHLIRTSPAGNTGRSHGTAATHFDRSPAILQISRRMHAALESSIAAHFPGNHAINCMCHSTENLYRFAATSVARASDDFYPRDPASSTPHIAACAFNSLFLGALVQPDWDMFHSRHAAAALHAAARAVSGAAVYVSDKPGEHDVSLLQQLVLPDGGVLRGSLPGRPTRDCLFVDPLRDGVSLLKVWNVGPVAGVVGVFHLQVGGLKGVGRRAGGSGGARVVCLRPRCLGRGRGRRRCWVACCDALSVQLRDDPAHDFLVVAC